MNTKIAIALALISLLGCSTSQRVQTPPPEISRPLRLDSVPIAPPVVIAGRICKLGTSCLAMDPRPFEPCLLSTKHCSDKATEPLLVAPAPSIIPAPQWVYE